MINPNFVIFGVFLQFIGGISYLLDTVKGRVKPNKVTWLLWSIAPLIAFFAEIKQGVGIQSLATFIVGFVPLLVFIASFINKEAEWKIGRTDIICGILSVLGNIAIFFSILADGLAAIPTVIKSYHKPETESVLVYFFGIINAGIALGTIPEWSFQHFGFPGYLLVLNLILVLLIQFKLGKLVELRM